MDPLNILIVEDTILTAMDLRETLEAAGHRVTAIARDYDQALKAIQKQSPDLALIDIRLDGSTADGIATAREVLAQRRMPIIFLTAYSEPQTFQAAKETLPAAFLLKPFRHDELKLQIELAYYNFHVGDAATSPAAKHLFLPIDKGYEKTNPDDVLYLKADGAYVKVFVLGKEQPHHISTNLSHLAQYFPTANFYRLSRSLLINLNHLERIERNHLFLVNHKTAIPIPAANRKELTQKLRIVRTK